MIEIRAHESAKVPDRILVIDYEICAENRHHFFNMTTINIAIRMVDQLSS
jgi:hypothetical protein